MAIRESQRAVVRTAVRNETGTSRSRVTLLCLWLLVLAPLAWGVLEALKDVQYLFR